MFPANSKHMKRISKLIPSALRHLLQERECRVIKHDNTHWPDVRKDPRLLLNIDAGAASFDVSNYSQISNAIMYTVESQQSTGTQKPTTVIQADDESLPHVRTVVKNACRLHRLPDTAFRVADYQGNQRYGRNMLDFVSMETEGFSVRLLSDQRKYSEGGVRLSHVLEEFVDVLDWETAYRQHQTNVIMQSASPNNPKSFKIMEHALHREHIEHPIVVEAPRFFAKVDSAQNNFLTNSAFESYQYCLKIPDKALPVALRYLTTYSAEEVEEILSIHQEQTSTYHGHKKVAENIIRINHDADLSVLDCLFASNFLYNGKVPEWEHVSQSELVCLERVLHVCHANCPRDATFTELCVNITDNLPPHLKNHFDGFVGKTIAKGKFYSNGAARKLDHKFSDSDRIGNYTILANKRRRNTVAFMVKWTTS